jgi:hypothetical protein
LFGICDLGQNNEQEEKKGAVGEGKKVEERRGEERRGEEKRRERRGVCGGWGGDLTKEKSNVKVDDDSGGMMTAAACRE